MHVSKRIFAVGAMLTAGAMVIAGASQAIAVQPPGADSTPASASTLAVNGAASIVAAKPAFLMASADDAFVQQKVISSSEGNIQYVPYERTYRGLPVIGGDFVMVMKNGQSVFNSVAQEHAIGNISVLPTLKAADAEKVASGLLSGAKVESSKLAVYALGSGAAKLAWETYINGTGAEGYSRLSVVVDAQTGAVLDKTEHVMHGTGTSAWSTNPVTINTTQSGSTFSMLTPSFNNMPCQNATGNATFTGPDDVWGSTDKTNRETGCVDALYGAQREIQMLSTWLGRNGMDGSGGAWPIRVGLNDVNAFYDGTQVQIGHRQGTNEWIGAVDVIAHEMGHGIDDHTPGGISGSGTQEFIADTFGASTEWFINAATGDTPDYLVGEQINLVGSGPIRNMFNPSAVGDPNCYSSSIPGGEVHASAGPGNHWFYLLSQGSNPTNGQPTSPTCNSSTVTGAVGPMNAIKILYGAMLMKTTGSSYLRYRTWTLQSAKNLDASCAMFNTTKAAWDAVSVPAQAGDPTCTGGPTPLALANPGNQTGTVGTAASLSLSATGGTTPYTFSATGLPAGLSINASSGVISGTPTTAGTSSVTATVTDNASPTHATASQTFNWTINAVGSCSSPGQKLGNPGFEVGSAPWTATANVIGAFAGQTAHGGTRFAWENGYGTTHTDTLSQTVTLPAGCANYTLQFWLHIDSAETTTTTQFDKLTVQVNTTTIATFSNLNKAAGYQLRTFNLAAFAGQTITLKLTGTEDSSLQTSFVSDDYALNVS